MVIDVFFNVRRAENSDALVTCLVDGKEVLRQRREISDEKQRAVFLASVAKKIPALDIELADHELTRNLVVAKPNREEKTSNHNHLAEMIINDHFLRGRSPVLAVLPGRFL